MSKEAEKKYQTKDGKKNEEDEFKGESGSF